MSEAVVNLDRARHILGGGRPCGCGGLSACDECGGRGTVATPLGRNYMTTLKRAMGIRGRYFCVEDMRRWLQKHPEFDGRSSSGVVDTYRRLLEEARPCVERAGKASLLDRIERKLAA